MYRVILSIYCYIGLGIQWIMNWMVSNIPRIQYALNLFADCIVSYGLKGRKNRSSIAGRDKGFGFSQNCADRSWSHPTTYTIGMWRFIQKLLRPKCGTNHSQPSYWCLDICLHSPIRLLVVVLNEAQGYLYSLTSSWVIYLWKQFWWAHLVPRCKQSRRSAVNKCIINVSLSLYLPSARGPVYSIKYRMQSASLRQLQYTDVY
jgi:hypothetical protein